MIAQNDEKFAEALKALSLEEDDYEEESSPRRSRKWVWGAAVLTPLVLVGSLAAYRPDVVQAWGINPELLTLDQLRQIELLERIWPAAEVPETANPQPAEVPSAVAEVPTPTPVPVAPVAAEITGSGYVVATQTTSIFAPLEGRAQSVSVELGDRVAAGDELLRLEGNRERFALENAQLTRANADLTLAAAGISLRQARADYERITQLVERGANAAITLSDAKVAVERAENTYAQAQLEADQADLSSRIAEHEVSQLVVRAPFAGQITNLNVLAGDMVAGQDGPQLDEMALMTLVDTNDLTIEAEISETNIAPIRQGVRGEAVLDAFADAPFDIILDSIAPVASAQKGTITLRFKPVNPPSGIRPNMAVRIRIVPTQQNETRAAKRSE